MKGKKPCGLLLVRSKAGMAINAETNAVVARYPIVWTRVAKRSKFFKMKKMVVLLQSPGLPYPMKTED